MLDLSGLTAEMQAVVQFVVAMGLALLTIWGFFIGLKALRELKNDEYM